MMSESGCGVCKRLSTQKGLGLAVFLSDTARETQKVQNPCPVFERWYSVSTQHFILRLAWRYLVAFQTVWPQRVLAKFIFWKSECSKQVPPEWGEAGRCRFIGSSTESECFSVLFPTTVPSLL